MVGVNLIQRSSAIFNVGTQKLRSKLELHLFDALAVGVAEEKTDHPIVKDPIDKEIDDLAQLGLAAKLLVKCLSHRYPPAFIHFVLNDLRCQSCFPAVMVAPWAIRSKGGGSKSWL